jgi:histidyl-tRNA synthetase
LRSALAYADREGFQQAALVGDYEAASETVRLRDMTSGQEETLPLASVAALVQRGRTAAAGASHGS